MPAQGEALGSAGKISRAEGRSITLLHPAENCLQKNHSLMRYAHGGAQLPMQLKRSHSHSNYMEASHGNRKESCSKEVLIEVSKEDLNEDILEDRREEIR